MISVKCETCGGAMTVGVHLQCCWCGEITGLSVGDDDDAHEYAWDALVELLRTIQFGLRCADALFTDFYHYNGRFYLTLGDGR